MNKMGVGESRRLFQFTYWPEGFSVTNIVTNTVQTPATYSFIREDNMKRGKQDLAAFIGMLCFLGSSNFGGAQSLRDNSVIARASDIQAPSGYVAYGLRLWVVRLQVRSVRFP
jgi:hypothetical protein